MQPKKVRVIGAGLAGCEAAYHLVKNGYQVELYEMRPHTTSLAHHTENMAELVCSNSLKNNGLEHASGLLKAEMRMLDSLLLWAADQSAVPAGQALAVDRMRLSQLVEHRLFEFPNFVFIRKEITDLNSDIPTIVATGPLTSELFSAALERLVGKNYLYFYDAAAPLVYKDSIDFSKVYFKSRYDKLGSEDYVNCPMSKDTFFAFYLALIQAKTVARKSFEKEHFYEGCMPIEQLAKRGFQTLTFGPMKPVGLELDTGVRPYAVVQLRQDNVEGTLYNFVGFQTNLTFGEQARIFRMIPGLEKAEFARYGVMHRNTYLDSPRLLQSDLALKLKPNIWIAGQLSGVEGYVESAAIGLLAAWNVMARLQGKQAAIAPKNTILGSLQRYITDTTVSNFQPMNANYGILATLEKKKDKIATSSLEEIRKWKDDYRF